MKETLRLMLDHQIGKLVDKRRVRLSPDSVVIPAEVKLVVAQVGVVGTDVQDDRECAGRIDAGDEAVNDGFR